MQCFHSISELFQSNLPELPLIGANQYSKLSIGSPVCLKINDLSVTYAKQLRVQLNSRQTWIINWLTRKKRWKSHAAVPFVNLRIQTRHFRVYWLIYGWFARFSGDWVVMGTNYASQTARKPPTWNPQQNGLFREKNVYSIACLTPGQRNRTYFMPVQWSQLTENTNLRPDRTRYTTDNTVPCRKAISASSTIKSVTFRV